jgi:hypothetical protein
VLKYRESPFQEHLQKFACQRRAISLKHRHNLFESGSYRSGAKRITNNRFPLYPLSFCPYPFNESPGAALCHFSSFSFDHSSLLCAPPSSQGLIFYWLHNPVFFSAGKSHKLTRVDSREKNAMKIQASFVKDGKWWVAWSDDVPGALTQGATLKEARENLADAVRMIRAPIDLSKLPKSKVVIEQLEV